MRICDICGVVDDGPRHVIAHGPGTVPVDEELVDHVTQLDLPKVVIRQALAALADTTLQIRHIACCAANGCDLCSTPTLEED